MKDLKLIVYQMLTSSIQAIGMVQEYISLSYNPCFNEVGSFTLTIPFSKENFDLVIRQDDCEKLISLGDGFVGIAYKVYIKNTPDKKQIQIKGQLAEGILENNAAPALNISPSSAATNLPNIEQIISDYISTAITNTATSTWWQGVVFTPSNPQNSSYVLTDGVQVEAGTSRKFIESLSKAADKGYSVRLKTQGTTDLLELKINSYTDRTISQSQVDPVVISAKLGDLYSSEFTLNSQNWKNIVYAYGTYSTSDGDETEVMEIVTYDEYQGGISDIPVQQRRATYAPVDIQFESGETPTEAGARAIARREGKLVLYDYALVKSYGCKIQEHNGTFSFGVDYFLGDKMTIYDEELGIQIDAQLLEYTKTYSAKGESFEPVFGFSQPTLNRILKQKGVI